jgi:hypothetical protein
MVKRANLANAKSIEEREPQILSSLPATNANVSVPSMTGRTVRREIETSKRKVKYIMETSENSAVGHLSRSGNYSFLKSTFFSPSNVEVENDFNDLSSEKEIPENLFSPAVDLMDIITEIVEEDSRIVEQAHSQPLGSPAVEVVDMMAEIVEDGSRIVTKAHSQPIDCSPAVNVMDVIAEIGEEGSISFKQAAHSQPLYSAVICKPMMVEPSRGKIMHSYAASLKATGFPPPKRRRR